MIITARLIEALDARPIEVRRFRQVFGEGPVTEAEAIKRAADIDIVWGCLAQYLLSTEQEEEFWRVCDQAWPLYWRQKDEAEAEYRRIQEGLIKKYLKGDDPALHDHDGYRREEVPAALKRADANFAARDAFYKELARTFFALYNREIRHD